jgi:hypothetical protein
MVSERNLNAEKKPQIRQIEQLESAKPLKIIGNRAVGRSERGFQRAELTATLTGSKLFGARRYAPMEDIRVPPENGEILPVRRMAKSLR